MLPQISTSVPEILSILTELKNARTECCAFIYLDQYFKVIDTIQIYSRSKSSIHIKLKPVIKAACSQNCHSLVVIHNHPSGRTYPSRSDLDSTMKLKDLTALLGIHMIDHIIITNENYFSFAEEGIIFSLEPSSLKKVR